MVEVFIRLCTDNPEDRKRLLEWIKEDANVVDSGQQKIDENSNENVEFASPKQRALMKRLKIVFDEDISKGEASRLITSKLGKKDEEE